MKDILKNFQEIAEFGAASPEYSLLRKAVVSCKQNRVAFNHDQMKRVDTLLIKEKPYILFKSKSDTKEYTILLFWATSIEDSTCKIQEHVDIVKREVETDEFKLTFRVEKVPDPKRQIQYLINNLNTLAVQNDD